MSSEDNWLAPVRAHTVQIAGARGNRAPKRALVHNVDDSGDDSDVVCTAQTEPMAGSTPEVQYNRRRSHQHLHHPHQHQQQQEQQTQQQERTSVPAARGLYGSVDTAAQAAAVAAAAAGLPRSSGGGGGSGGSGGGTRGMYNKRNRCLPGGPQCMACRNPQLKRACTGVPLEGSQSTANRAQQQVAPPPAVALQGQQSIGVVQLAQLLAPAIGQAVQEAVQQVMRPPAADAPVAKRRRTGGNSGAGGSGSGAYGSSDDQAAPATNASYSATIGSAGMGNNMRNPRQKSLFDALALSYGHFDTIPFQRWVSIPQGALAVLPAAHKRKGELYVHAHPAPRPTYTGTWLSISYR